MLSLVILSAAMSIDALGIGVSYGIRQIRLAPSSMAVISAVSLVICGLSSFLGSLLPVFFNPRSAELTGCIMLFSIGLFILYQGVLNTDTENKKHKKENLPQNKKSSSSTEEKTVFSLFIKALGITVNIIKAPETGDIDKSNIIEPKEALYLGAALSVDSVGAAAGGAALGINPFIFTLALCIAQILFLLSGTFLAGKIKLKSEKSCLPSLASALVLIIIALWKTASMLNV